MLRLCVGVVGLIAACCGLPGGVDPVVEAPPAAVIVPGELQGSWPELADHEGKQVLFTGFCNADTPTVRIEAALVNVNWGQEDVNYDIVAATSAGHVHALTLRSASGTIETLTATKQGKIWVFTGLVNWSSPINRADFASLQHCCAEGVGEMISLQVIDSFAKCPPSNPVPPELHKSFPMLHMNDGREVRLTTMCGAEPLTLTLIPGELLLNLGQEQRGYVVANYQAGADGFTLWLHSEGEGQSDLVARREGNVWVWTGPALGREWRTPDVETDFPAFKQCCTSTEADPVESVYATVEAGRGCPA